MKLHKQHLYYQADGAETGNTEGQNAVETDESPEIPEPKEVFSNDMALDDMEKGLDVLNQGSNDLEEEIKPKTEEAETLETTEVKEELKPTYNAIDDEFIEQHPEDADILVKIKGEVLSPKALKNYIHSQRHIEELKASRSEVVQPKQELNATAEKPLATYTDEEVSNYKTSIITRRIKEKYPDFPEDALTNRESLNLYYSDMLYERPADLDDFKSDFADIRDSISTEIEREVEVGRNWKGYAEQTILEGFKTFDEFIQSKGVTATEMGIDLSSPEVAKSVLYDKNGNANPDVVFIRKGVPIVMKDRFIAALKEKYMDDIISSKEKRAGDKAYTQRKTAEPPPSISNSNLVNKAPSKTLGKVVTDNMSLEEAEEILRNS